MVNSEEVLTDAEEYRNEWEEYVRDVANVFHDKEGELFTQEEALSLVTYSLDISDSTAGRTIAALVGDIVDPIVQVPIDGEKYIGVVEYNEYNGAYGYVHYDDIDGQQKRVVCAKCVQEKELDKNVVNATSGHGSFNEDAGFDELLDAVHKHYESDHNEIPENVETGASLLSGTTIAGNTAFHAGNDGIGSGLNADTLQGNAPADLRQAITKQDEAETFAESDVTVGTTSTAVESGSIKLEGIVLDQQGTTVQRDADTSTKSMNEDGVAIEPNTELDGVELEISSNTSGADTARIIRNSDKQTIAQKSISNLGGGATVELQATLSAGVEYGVAIDGDGTSGTDGGSTSFPVSSTDIDMTRGWYNAGTNTFSAGVSSVTALFGTETNSGSATIEWSDPNYINSWDVATFNQTLDGETVDVFVEESTDGGSTWTEIQGPISRGDPIQASASSEVRFRVDISRADTANNPTLDAIYRRYEV